jgi:chromosome segregation ATPase
MADEDLHEDSEHDLNVLYCTEPKGFTAQRTELSAAAKRRGDREAAKHISAARRPTTAAWMINRLVLSREETKQQLSELGDRLRAAHSKMDGDRIRRLSAEQRKLVEELVKAAVEAADAGEPSSALREDLTTTLQAAIADPEVRERLGRLTKAEQWSGFGALGDAEDGDEDEPEPKPKDVQREKLQKAVAAAEHASADAKRTLQNAERDLRSAEQQYDQAKEAARAAADLVKEAKAQLKRA